MTTLDNDPCPGDILIGTMVHCRGCGKILGGPICVVIPEGYSFDWMDVYKFPPDDCPVCKMRDLLDSTLDQYPLDMLRAVIIRKQDALRATLLSKPFKGKIDAVWVNGERRK